MILYNFELIFLNINYMILNNMKYNKVPLHLYINAMNAMRLNRLFECVDDKGCTNKIKLNSHLQIEECSNILHFFPDGFFPVIFFLLEPSP